MFSILHNTRSSVQRIFRNRRRRIRARIIDDDECESIDDPCDEVLVVFNQIEEYIDFRVYPLKMRWSDVDDENLFACI
jgi:hypothetical protein